MSQNAPLALLMAGIPQLNSALYHRIRFLVGDPAAYVQIPTADGGVKSTLILRDIEMDRARRFARADEVACPADFTPASGLSGDRETATAQAAAECLRRAGATRVMADRTLPLIFADLVREAGIGVQCDTSIGVADRRRKDPEELEHIRHSQQATEQIIERTCRLIARAEARRDGVLLFEGRPLTSERIRAMINHWFIDLGYVNPPSIIAGGPIGADCHDLGHGELRTGEPVIVDVFPRDETTLYYGDCTRSVVHGDVPDEVARMHAAVCDAKRAGMAAARGGVTGEDVHRATIATIVKRGYKTGLPPADAPDDYCAMTHGTGHGVGLECHEPPLLDFKGPELIAGELVTIEPGLYRRGIGGVRVEDIVLIHSDRCESLNKLPEGLDWK
ncbi:MAG: M24 family metallopeptidase [Thermoguttaceae bacterium]|jgi:Xaa-Pro aminopeptidase